MVRVQMGQRVLVAGNVDDGFRTVAASKLVLDERVPAGAGASLC